MKLEILMSCMYQKDDSIIKNSNITGNVLVVNQCDKEEYAEYKTPHGVARIFFTCQRGLTKSRNMAIALSDSDICLLSDDDEIFVDEYEQKILNAYELLPDADIIIFKMVNRAPSFSDKIQKLRFPKTMKVSSWQISFRRKSLLEANVKFDELLGAGTGNGAEEELKFLTDCEKKDLTIFYVPVEIASVGQTESTWFNGFDEQFFENRGATTRYILGLFTSSIYAVYYLLRKYRMYSSQISFLKALKAIFRGIKENRISKLR